MVSILRKTIMYQYILGSAWSLESGRGPGVARLGGSSEPWFAPLKERDEMK